MIRDLRPHHFYDIIRNFGRGEKIKPHPYLHSFHKVAELIRSNPNLKIRIVRKCDCVCEGCIHNKNGICNDLTTHRKDFTLREEFNNHIDKRIIEKCLISEGDILTPIQLCNKAKQYLDNIDWIYLGNDFEHTKKRKNNVIKGLKYYSDLHNFNLQP